ncbi:hypothetical protein DL771_006806 [Monosporascus sp. 5C6A]|nr:hypothetical protein DL771_006806 [Monosporascus sp. 5C6A]
MATQTQVLVAHTGQRLQVDISQFSSLDDFKGWKEIYVYDIRITQASSPGTPTSLVSEAPIARRYVLTAAPNEINDSRSLQSWQALFKSRRDWASNIVNDCTAMANTAHARYDEMEVMLRCLDAAVANLDTALKPLEPKYNELKKWIIPTQEDYTNLATNWERHLESARSIAISPAMVRFMTGQEVRKSRQATLEDLIDPETTRKAGKLATTSLRKFNNKISELDKTAERMFAECDQLFQEFDKLMARSALHHADECRRLLEDIEAVAKKIDTDYQATLLYVNPARDVPQASKTAVNHTKQLLPSMQNRALEMEAMVRYATQARNDVARDSLAFMRNIAEITSLHANVKNQMNVITQGEEEMTTFDYLRLIQQLPFMYASFVAEALRRREWADKVKADSSTLVNEMALFQDEELKRRRKWHKMVGSTYGPEKTENNVLGVEVNILGEEEAWPAMTRHDLNEFLTVIQRHNAEPSVVDDVAKLIDELNNPTKQQSKRVKAFKNGSVHEAVLGRSGLLIRGDDELLRSLQDDKSKLENKLRTAESRVRRLEDLLHRHSQASRPSLFQPQQQSADRNDSTVSAKANQPNDDRRRSSTSDSSAALLDRIAKLEGDLSAERERAAALEKEAQARITDVQEVNSTKNDLLGNMEALKREFLEERKLLEAEIKALKMRLEETEEEIEHFGESRDNEKLAYDEKVHYLEEEIGRLTREKMDDVLKSQGQLDFLRSESRAQRERNVSLERQLQEAREAIKTLSRRAETYEENTETHAKSLKELHSQLSPKEAAPQEITDLIESLANKSADVLAKVRSLEEDLSLTKTDLDHAQGTIKEIKSDLSATQERLSAEEMASVHLRESLDKEKARCATLEAEVRDGREQIDRLRGQMTEGESGSETLRKKLEDEEKRVAELCEQLASRQSQVGSLEEEVRMFQEKLHSSETRTASLDARLESRNEHTKSLTQRLYTHNERLCRLLERLSFSITRHDDGSMTFQKIPRSERTFQNPNDSSDPGTSIRRSVSLATNMLADSADLRLLYWMNAEDSETEEEQFQAYMAGPGNFDIDKFSDAIYRRIKEVEHTARKMTRDARGYRERAHTLAKEAHDKIAFKHFKEGDLALFLPTRNQTTGAWAAFNVGCPHFFLREQESHRLRSREWLVARITRIQERVVDLSKSLQSTAANAAPSEGETDSVNTGDEFDNPFDLSDGLRWWLIDAHEDKPGAPSTPGLGKSTIAANNVAAVADMHNAHARTSSKSKSKLLGGLGGSTSGIDSVSRTLHKSLESRRSSSGSKKALPFTLGGGSGSGAAAKGSALASETNSLRAAPADSPVVESPTSIVQSVAGPSGESQGQYQQGGLNMGNGKNKAAANGGADGQRQQLTNERGHRADAIPPPHSNPKQSPERRTARGPRAHWDSVRADRPHPRLQRDVSDASAASEGRSVIWDSLWNLDLTYPAK